MINYVTNYGEYNSHSTPALPLIDNYLYSYHTKTLIVLPTFPESINDSLPANFATADIMGRSAPIFSYSNSGPRKIQINLDLHRDMLDQVNIDASNFSQSIKQKLNRMDYMELMINELQSIALPSYAVAQKMVDPPLVAIRLGDQVFCKGIVEGGVTVDYKGPIIANPLYDDAGNYLYDSEGKRRFGKGKYALASISFSVTEIDPYDAETVATKGSFRGLDLTLERNVYRR